MNDIFSNDKHPQNSIFFYTLHKTGTSLLRNFFFNRIENFRHIDLFKTVLYSDISNYNLSLENYNTLYAPLYLPSNLYLSKQKKFMPEIVFDLFKTNFVYNKICFFLIRDPRDILISQYYSFGFTHSVPQNPDAKEHMLEVKARIQSQSLDQYVLSDADELMSRFEVLIELFQFSGNGTIIRYEDLILTFSAVMRQLKKYFSFSKENENILFLKSRPNTEENFESHKRSGEINQFSKKLKPKTISLLDEKFNRILNYFNYE